MTRPATAEGGSMMETVKIECDREDLRKLSICFRLWYTYYATEILHFLGLCALAVSVVRHWGGFFLFVGKI